MSNIDHDKEIIEEAAERIAGILIGEPKPRKSFDETKERAWSGLAAWKEEPEATHKDSLSVEIELPPLPKRRTCAKCGVAFEVYENGCIKPTVCRDCMNEKISKGMLKRHRKESSEKPMEKKQGLPPTLTLAFSGKNDAQIYEAICASAEKDRRTPENQVLHFLELAMDGFGADVTFALEEAINREEK